MITSDPIADMLTRIRNAMREGHSEVILMSSKVKIAIAKVLQREGFLSSYRVEEKPYNKKYLHLELKYFKKRSVISKIQRVSLPSRRVYSNSQDIPRVLGGLGILILSTSSGIISGREAKQKNVGGEILCEVW